MSTLDEIQQLKHADGWEEIVIPAQITGLGLFRSWLIIGTLNGIFLAPSQGVEGQQYVNDHLFVKLTPEARETICIIAAGRLPWRLEEVPISDIAVEQNALSGSFVFALKSDVEIAS